MEPILQTPLHLLGVQEELAHREHFFHYPEYGTTREALEAMTDETFWEVGASGQRYSRQYVIDTVLQRSSEPREDKWKTKDLYCQEISPDNYLLTYTLMQGSRVTRRSTIWRNTSTGWKVIYHQGTVVESDK